MFPKTIIAVAISLLAACTTQTLSDGPGQASLLTPAYARPDPGRGTLTVLRESSFGGAACIFRLLLDGAAVADLALGQLATLHVPPGDHVLSIELRGALCSSGVTATIAAPVVAGKRRAFRAGFSGFSPHLTAAN